MTSDITLSANRRDFMKTALAGAGAAWGTGLVTNSVRAAELPHRIGSSHMKLSLAAYSFNRFLSNRFRSLDANAKMTLLDFIDFCAELDLDGCELTGYYFPREITHKYLMHLKDKTFRLGLDISGTAIGNDFCLPEGEAREKQLSMCREWIDYAAIIGAPVIRIFAGRIPKGGTEDEAVEHCVEGINQSLEYAAQKGVHLALENHGGITATPKQMLNIIKGIKKSPWFGVNFDSGNFRTSDPYGDLEKIAPYAINAQIKVSVTRNGKKEPSDLKRTIQILKQADYRGWVVLEYEERNDPKKTIPEYIKRLRELI
jgi:sugar phosphate isomerase/epimerase